HSPRIWDDIDWVLEPEFLLRDPDLETGVTLPAFPSFGLLDFRLLADIASGFSVDSSGETTRIRQGRLGIRVDGLPAGYYRVYAIAADPQSAIKTWIGTDEAAIHPSAPAAGFFEPVLGTG